MIINVELVMNRLKERRKVFVSEADFQLEFAWTIKEIYPDIELRLEYCPVFDRKMHIDILLIKNQRWIPIELKYKTKGCIIKDGEEKFVLAHHGAKDVNCYLYLKDIQRVEYIKEKMPSFAEGYTIMLTNEPTYLKSPQNEDCVYREFSIHEGSVKEGMMNWSPKAGFGTVRGHEEPITLKGRYEIHWKEYCRINESTSGVFYYLINYSS